MYRASFSEVSAQKLGRSEIWIKHYFTLAPHKGRKSTCNQGPFKKYTSLQKEQKKEEYHDTIHHFLSFLIILTPTTLVF
jgi:hypothetical protein